MNEFFGKYRGTVEGNDDKENRGRLWVSVPAIFGEQHRVWAEPCVPFAGPGVGFVALPPEKASVWIEFEQGNVSSPIWTGCFWKRGQMPEGAILPDGTILRTKLGAITISQRQDGASLDIKLHDGPSITLAPGLIELRSGRGAILRLSNKLISLNDGALEVE